MRSELSYGTGRTQKYRRSSGERLSAENQGDDSELLKNIKRLTVRVLDNLDKGSENRTLDEQQKRLLSSTGARLLRLWRIVQKEGESKRAAEAAGKISELSAQSEKTEEGSNACLRNSRKTG